MQEYWENWMEVDSKDSLKKLYNHPSLTKKDFETVNIIVSEYKQKQFFYSLGFTFATLGIYSVFFQKNRIFYNFFRKKSKFRFWPYVRRGTSAFFCFWGWLLMLNYLFDKHIPSVVNEKKLFAKYSIIYEP